MNYNEITSLFNERFEKGIKPYITEDEAKEYLGQENLKIIEMLLNYCYNQGYKIYIHETGEEAANDIITRGFIGHGSAEEISRDEFIQKSGMKPGDKLTVSGMLSRATHLGILDDGQHFVQLKNIGSFSYADFVYANVNRSACGAKCIAIVPEELPMFQSQHTQYGVKHSHINEYTGKNEPQSYFQREVVDKEFFIGYFDVINKKWVINKNFELHHREGIGSKAYSDGEPFTAWIRQQIKSTRVDFEDNER